MKDSMGDIMEFGSRHSSQAGTCCLRPFHVSTSVGFIYCYHKDFRLFPDNATGDTAVTAFFTEPASKLLTTLPLASP